jgi:hypothetical protein
MRRFLLICLLIPFPVLGQKLDARIDCKAANGGLIYECVIWLTQDGKPLSGAQISVGADMPSMPMAHNLRPANARPGTRAGEYLVRLDLDMPGEWAVKLKISGPVRDQLVLHYRFTESGATISDPRRKR